MNVLVAHPGIQYSHQLAWALEDAGALRLFCSGVPVSDAPQVRHTWGHQIRQVPIPPARRKHYAAFPVLRRVSSKVFHAPRANAVNHWLDGEFDQFTAKWVDRIKPDMVVCYENSALHTFRAARKHNAICVLDAASIHFESGRRLGASAVRRDPAWVEERKREELVLADAILTCSALAAETYVDAGVPADRVFPVPLGTDLPVGIQKAASAHGDGLSVVFVGSPSYRKGVDLLLDVFDVFHQTHVPITLTIMGGAVDAALEERAKRLPNVIRKSFVAQPALFHEYAAHDCLVLPSRFDSFGMVVAEAMAVGTPAIVTDRVGARCIIDENPGAGWVVSCDKKSLSDRLLWLLANKEILLNASKAARRSAQAYSWASYRARVTRTLQDISERLTRRSRNVE